MVRFLFRSDWTLAARDGAYMKHSFRQDLSAKLKADFQQDYQDFFVLVGSATVPTIFPGTR